jgi:hypothetical protein
MNIRQFDDLTRSMVSARSRRGALRLLAGAALGAFAARPEAGAARGKCKRGKELCRGDCVKVCKGLKQRNRRTCECDCPDRMKDCGRTCIGRDRCCPNERRCASGGCVPKGACCHDEQRCADRSCRPKEGGECCPEERPCDGACISAINCCPSTERQCRSGACIPKGNCCVDTEAPCATAPGGCCNSAAGEECSDDGCCNVLAGLEVCGGKCVDPTNDANHCGGYGVKCGSCQTCQDGVCRGPDRATCETCANGEVVPGVPCGDHCCNAGAGCCGGGCCAPGKCTSQNGQTCCLKVVDNRLICLAM